MFNKIDWNEHNIINTAITKFGESIELDTVFANKDSDVAELKAEKATLDTRLNNLTAPTGKPKLYFVSMFEPYYDYSYA